MDYLPINTIDELLTTMKKEKAALFYFSTNSCNVCKVLKPKISELINSNFPEIKLYYIDIERAPLISGQFRIFSIPSILIYFEGKEFYRKSRNIGLNELEETIERPFQVLFEK